MPYIAVLSQHLVNKIAAGEVVERPASVVKELLENSLDAGAKRINLEIEDGGKKLIRITDDGCGMDAEDLQLAFTPHATSKIRSDEDLFAIKTMGFRGEALASIGSVSQVEAISRPAENQEGYRLTIDGGEFTPIAPTAAPPGTSITIRNLFFNTPARRKFLRATNTEMGHISDQFTRIALPATSVQFILTHNNRQLHHLPENQSLIERVGMLFGNDMAAELMSIRRKDRGVEITGLVAPPSRSKPNTQGQYIFLNGRCIRDRFTSHAIREAYRGLMEINRQPIVFIFIALAPDAVDVNVHPAKAEVRFADSNLIHGQVLAAIRDKLLSSDLSRPLRGADSLTPSSFITADEEEENEISDNKQRVRQAMADFFRNARPQPPSVNPHKNGSTGNLGTRAAGRMLAKTSAAENLSPWENRGQEARDTIYTHSGEPQTISPINPEELTEAPPPHRFMQVHNAYLVAESDDGLIIIDQHALHERILYEQMHRRLQEGPLPSQRCLIPEVVDVTGRQMAALEEATELLAELGVTAEPFGPTSIAVQGYPAMLEKTNPADFIRDVLDVLSEQRGKLTREELLHSLLDTLACKAAVKAGDPLTDDEISALLAQRPAIDRHDNCPHGRPTTLRLSRSQLEKEFKRT
ncbi:MAG: DNA mismatch repair endonuclease MutL [Sedimentisphaerales bacterium]|nr:DNA mismatch repair endonuclease MutL [Sedimentisphaerales bacterium]